MAHRSSSKDKNLPEGREETIYLARAVLTGYVSKLAGVLPQLVVLPLAFQLMGPELFGVYGVLLGLITSVSLLDLAIGPALTRLVTREMANRQPSAGLRMGLYITLILSAGYLFCGIIYYLSGSKLLGMDPTSSDVQKYAIFVGLILLTLAPFAGYSGRVAIATANLHHYNSFTAIGNVMAAAITGALLMSNMQMSPGLLLSSLNGVQTLTRIAAGAYIWRKAYIPGRGTGVSLRIIKTYLIETAAFTPTVVNGMVVREIIRFGIALKIGLTAAGSYSLLAQYGFAISGILMTFTGAKWPLLSMQLEKHDFKAIKASLIQLTYYCVATCIIIVTIGIIAYNYLPIIKNDNNGSLNPIITLLYAIYISVTIWSHVTHVIFMALGCPKFPSVVCLIQWGFIILVVATISNNDLYIIISFLIFSEFVALIVLSWKIRKLMKIYFLGIHLFPLTAGDSVVAQSRLPQDVGA